VFVECRLPWRPHFNIICTIFFFSWNSMYQSETLNRVVCSMTAPFEYNITNYLLTEAFNRVVDPIITPFEYNMGLYRFFRRNLCIKMRSSFEWSIQWHPHLKIILTDCLPAISCTRMRRWIEWRINDYRLFTWCLCYLSRGGGG